MHCDNCGLEIDYDVALDVYRDNDGRIWCDAADPNDVILHEIS